MGRPTITCTGCQQAKKKYALGRCRSCYRKNRYKTDPIYAERHRENQRRLRKARPGAAYQRLKKRLKSSSEKRVKYHKQQSESKMKFRYGITLSEYRVLIAKPCGICGTGESKRYLDHCHLTGRPRGPLCPRCNFLVGLLETTDQTHLGRALMWIDPNLEGVLCSS